MKQRTRTSEMVGEAGSGCHVSVSTKHRVLLKIDSGSSIWLEYQRGELTQKELLFKNIVLRDVAASFQEGALQDRPGT